MAILVLNAGSSSLKAAMFEGATRTRDLRVEEVGREAPRLSSGGAATPLPAGASHEDALAAMLWEIGDAAAGIDAVGHRIVHGGDLFTEPTILDAAAMRRLAELNALAPLHNPVALRVIDAARERLPTALQIGCFDTAFHAAQPEVARRFALPADPRTEGLRRYGFHGLSYQGLVDALTPPPRRLLACHLGAGASLCAIVEGRSVATTMGYSPLDGLVMGTRSGAIDPAAALALAKRIGVDAAEALLNRESGLLGLSGLSADMRALEASDDPRAAFAIASFIYWTVRHAGSMIAAMGGIDAVAFTGGVGENATAARRRICEGLAFVGLALRDDDRPDETGALHAADSAVAAYVVPADEEAVIARAALNLLGSAHAAPV